MIRYIKSKTSTGEIIKEKTITDNWWGTYHDICIFSWCIPPKYYDENGKQVSWREPSKKMVCVDRQRDVTVTLIKS